MKRSDWFHLASLIALSNANVFAAVGCFLLLLGLSIYFYKQESS